MMYLVDAAMRGTRFDHHTWKGRDRMNRRTLPLTLTILMLLVGSAHARQEEKQPTLKVGYLCLCWREPSGLRASRSNRLSQGRFMSSNPGPPGVALAGRAIPHVTEMQQKYAKDGVTFIGQDVFEQSEEPVQPFVEKMGDKMNYHVVMDTQPGQQGQMAQTWMAAAGQNGIPCSFLIDKTGTIAWIGHPMELEPVLQKVIGGKFDVKKEAAEQNAKEEPGRKFSKAMQSGDNDAALKMLDEYSAAHPEMAGRLQYTKFQILLRKKDYDAAYKAGQAIDLLKDESMALNGIAWPG